MDEILRSTEFLRTTVFLQLVTWRVASSNTQFPAAHLLQ